MSGPIGQADRRRSRRAERKEETRAELIEAAARVFARRGFHGASVDEIARESGYSTGAIYWHFSGKDDLFLAVYEDFAAALARSLEEIFARGDGGLPERARRAGDRWMERVRDEPEFLILAHEFLVHAWREPELRKAFEHRLAAVRLALARVIRHEAKGERLMPALPAEDLATVMRALGSALGLARLADPEGVRDGLLGDVLALLFEPRGRGAQGKANQSLRRARRQPKLTDGRSADEQSENA
jgi:AcrR family transcriptional regulator